MLLKVPLEQARVNLARVAGAFITLVYKISGTSEIAVFDPILNAIYVLVKTMFV